MLLGGLLGLPEALLGGLWTPKTLKNTWFFKVFAHAGFWIFQALKLVDRAAVDRAVDLARTLLSGAQGPGARAQGRGASWPLGTQGPHPKPHIPCYLNLMFPAACPNLTFFAT